MVRSIAIASAIASVLGTEVSLIQQRVDVESIEYDYDEADGGKGKGGKKGNGGGEDETTITVTFPPFVPPPPPDISECTVPLVCECLEEPLTVRESYVDWSLCDAEMEVGASGMPLRYKNVAPNVDLLLTSIGKYESFNVALNGRNGCLGRLNVASPGEAKIKFQLVEAGTETVLPAGTAYDFTVFDLDASPAGMIERVGVSGYASVDAVKLKAEEEDGRSWYTGTEINVDNPATDNLFKLSTDQIEASFSVVYEGTSEWVVDFKGVWMGNGREQSGGRNFLFAGASCASPDRKHCTCPPAPTPAPTPAPPVCATGAVCSCLEQPPALPDNHIDWKLCHSVVEVGEGGLPIRYKNVAEGIDLVVTNVTEYVANDHTKNGRNGCLGQFNIKSPGYVDMKFSLVQSGTNKVTGASSTKDITIFDFDKSIFGMAEMVGVHGYKELSHPGFSAEMDPASGTAWFWAKDTEVDNPDDLDNLDELNSDQIASSLVATYEGKSEWIVKFRAARTIANAYDGGRNFLFTGTSCVSKDRFTCECPSKESIFPLPLN